MNERSLMHNAVSKASREMAAAQTAYLEKLLDDLATTATRGAALEWLMRNYHWKYWTEKDGESYTLKARLVRTIRFEEE